MANPAHAAQKKQVMEVLADLDVVDPESGASDIPILEVWNKSDLLAPERLAELRDAATGQDAVMISAATGDGLDAFAAKIAEVLTAKAKELTVTLPVSDGRRIAWLHAHGEILSEEDAGGGEQGPLRRLTVRLNPKELGQYQSL